MKKIIIGVIIALIVIVAGFFLLKKTSTNVGNITNISDLETNTFAVGPGCDNSFSTCTGTVINRINTGICYIRPYATTIVATSTASVDCQGTLAWGASGMSALAGVTKDDNIVAVLSTTTAGTISTGLSIIGASASTTSGYIVLRVSNLTGNTYTWSTIAGTASGTASYIITK